MNVLLETGRYGSIITTDATPMGCFVIKCMSEAYILQEETTCDVQILNACELVVKAQYTKYMQENTKF